MTIQPHDFSSLSPPVWRASTVVFKTLEDFVTRKSRLPDGFTYGTTGTPTQRTLEARIAKLDSAQHCVVLPSGQAAVCIALLALVKAGDHLLMSESAYGPAKTFALRSLKNLGVEIELYDPCIGANIASLLRSNTQCIWLESPGSMTMEVQDIPAICAVAKSRNIYTVIDNTWASSLGLKPLDLGVDMTVQACTKYMGGHSDVLMGSVTTHDPSLYAQVRQLQAGMGQAVNAEDCFLISRGLDTMALRLQAQSRSTLQVAQYLASHPAVAEVLYPPLAQSQGHALWKRDFCGAGTLLSVALQNAPFAAYQAMFAAFKHFAIGASWGGVHSIAAYYPADEFITRKYMPCEGPLVRLSIGLEGADAIIEELDTALQIFQTTL